MPWQLGAQEVHETVAQGFEVVASRLFDAQVGVDRGIARCARQILILPVVDVLLARISVLFAEAKIDQVDSIACLADACREKRGSLMFTRAELEASDVRPIMFRQ